jgi:hypothetical protein
MDARTNQLTASFPSETAKRVYCEFAAASDACYSSINYRRQQTYFTDDESVWDAPVRKLREEYVPVIGSGTFDQIERKNADAWESFFELLDAFNDPENRSVTEKPSAPGYWGSRSEGYPLRTLVRNDLYEFELSEEGSTVEFTIGQALKKKYDFDYYERLRLDVHGDPRWTGRDGQLELCYDEEFDVVRVNHTVRQPDLRTSGHSHTQLGHTNRLKASSNAQYRPSTSARTTPSLPSPARVNPSSATLAPSSSDSGRCPSESPHSSPNSQTTTTRHNKYGERSRFETIDATTTSTPLSASSPSGCVMRVSNTSSWATSRTSSQHTGTLTSTRRPTRMESRGTHRTHREHVRRSGARVGGGARDGLFVDMSNV